MRLFWRLLPLVGLAVLAVQIAIWIPAMLAHAPNPVDTVDICWRAAVRLARGGSAYELCPRPGTEILTCFLYPPPFAVLLRPLGRLDEATFTAVACAFALGGFWLYASGLARLATGRAHPAAALVAGAILALTPGARYVFVDGGVDLAVWGLVSWALAVEAALPLLVLVAALKLWPIVPLAVLLARRPRRLVGAGAAALVIAAVTLGVLGVRAFADWVHLAGPTLAAGSLGPANVSLFMLPARLGFPLPRAAASIAPIAAGALVAVACRRQPARLQAVIAGVAALLCGPICWWRYAPVLLMPAALVIAMRASRAAGESAPRSAGASTGRA